MTETELKREVLKLAYAQGWAVYHETHSPRRGGQGIGYPDLTLARDREVMWFELKQEKASPSPEQSMWAAALPAYHLIRPSDWESGRVAELLA